MTRCRKEAQDEPLDGVHSKLLGKNNKYQEKRLCSLSGKKGELDQKCRQKEEDPFFSYRKRQQVLRQRSSRKRSKVIKGGRGSNRRI